MDPGGVGVKKQKKPKRTPPLPIENKFVDRTSRGKECICLSCNQKLLAQKGHQDKQVRWPNIIRSHFTGVQEVPGVVVPLCTNAHADVVAQCLARQAEKAESYSRHETTNNGASPTSEIPPPLSRGCVDRSAVEQSDGPVATSVPYGTGDVPVRSSSPRLVTVAATQFACASTTAGSEARAEALVRAAVAQGANIVLLQELFQCLSFPSKEQHERDLSELAAECDIHSHPLLMRFSALARELRAVLPISFFERKNNAYFNSVAVLDADGSLVGLYRKSHISDCEKPYVSPGDTGFRVFNTFYGTIGVGIGWDQWYPEAARAMVLQGAEVLLYPSAFGTFSASHAVQAIGHWHRTLVGHAAANLVPIVVSNRIGMEVHGGHSTGDVEGDVEVRMTFHGSSFITSSTGEISRAQLGTRSREAVLLMELDLVAARELRRSFGIFRDRRPDLYSCLLTRDGSTTASAIAPQNIK